MIASALAYGGINVFVVIFFLIPMAVPIFRQYDIAWPLVVIPIFGGGATYTMTMMPASPSLHNVVPSNALGTPLTAAPLPGILASLAAVAFLLLYMKVALVRSLEGGVNVKPCSSPCLPNVGGSVRCQRLRLLGM